MTRKDFQLIADVVKNIDDADTRAEVALHFGVKLRSTNPRFNLIRFVEACKAPKPNLMSLTDATDKWT